MTRLDITGNAFWALVQDGGKNPISLFSDKTEAIDELSALKDPNKADIMCIIRKSAQEWTVEQVTWKEIAAELIKASRK